MLPGLGPSVFHIYKRSLEKLLLVSLSCWLRAANSHNSIGFGKHFNPLADFTFHSFKYFFIFDPTHLFYLQELRNFIFVWVFHFFSQYLLSFSPYHLSTFKLNFWTFWYSIACSCIVVFQYYNFIDISEYLMAFLIHLQIINKESMCSTDISASWWAHFFSDVIFNMLVSQRQKNQLVNNYLLAEIHTICLTI